MIFSELERISIYEKRVQLEKVKNGTLKPKELADIITKRRLKWFEENGKRILSTYNGLLDVEKAYKLLVINHMQINSNDSKIKIISQGLLRFDSYNFCPYLIACNILKLDTKFICKEIGEPSIQAFIKQINPRLRFSRNYEYIRPYSHYCEEYFHLD